MSIICHDINEKIFFNIFKKNMIIKEIHILWTPLLHLLLINIRFLKNHRMGGGQICTVHSFFANSKWCTNAIKMLPWHNSETKCHLQRKYCTDAYWTLIVSWAASYEVTLVHLLVVSWTASYEITLVHLSVPPTVNISQDWIITFFWYCTWSGFPTGVENMGWLRTSFGVGSSKLGVGEGVGGLKSRENPWKIPVKEFIC